LFSNKTLLKLS
jgi:P-type E1-E2 ATPase